MEAAAKDAVKAQSDVIHVIANEWFPEAPAHASGEEKARRSAEREMAVAAIVQNEVSPAAGWRVVVDLKDTNGATMIVPIALYQTRDRMEVNVLNNAYGKNLRIKHDDGSWQQIGGRDFSWFVEQNIKKARILYMNTKKTPCGRSLLRAIPLAKARHRRLYLPLLYQMRLRM